MGRMSREKGKRSERLELRNGWKRGNKHEISGNIQAHRKRAGR